jgi:hypothetical protein
MEHGTLGGMSGDTAAAAFARADWKRLLPKLQACAARCLHRMGWVETIVRRPAEIEAQELVNRAIESVLSGDRSWVPGAGDTEEAFVAYLWETMRSIAANERTSAAVAWRDGSARLAKQVDRAPTPEDNAAATTTLARVEEALAEDAEATLLYRELTNNGGASRDELAEALRWDLQRVKVAKNRMKRRLAAAGLLGDASTDISKDDDQHGKQEATDDRRRTSREPVRGAVDPGR